MLKFVKVTGNSLEPEYREGDYVMVITFPFFRLKRGDTVVLRHPQYGMLIKKIEQIDSDKIYVIGLHTDSVDSRRFGPIKHKSVIGKVIWQFSKPEPY